MFNDFELTFPEVCARYVKDAYNKSSLIMEYGSGGSTLYAAKQGKKIISVESNSEWLLMLMARYKEKDLPGDIIPLWANIGKTKAWGYPENDEHWREWHRYSKLPWSFCKEHNINPDVILIDGRFRVASFIATCVFTKAPIQILFDDYVERPEYHWVNTLSTPDAIIGERMAVFNVGPGEIKLEALVEGMSYFYNPE